VRRLLSARDFPLQVMGMVETLQQTWNIQEPLEVVARLVHDAVDRLTQEQSLLVLLEELEASGCADPVAYLRGLVGADKQTTTGEIEVLVDYQRLPYSHLAGALEPPPPGTLWLGNRIILPDDFLGSL